MAPSKDTVGHFLRDSDTLLEGLRLGGVGVWRWKLDGETLDWTENLAAIHKLPIDAFDGTIASFQRDVHPDDRERVWEEVQTAISTGQPYRTLYKTPSIPGRELLWIEEVGDISVVDGMHYLTGTSRDVTDHVRIEDELRRRLRQQQGITHLGTFALKEDDLDKVMQRAVEVAAEIFEVPLTKILQFGDAADSLDLRAGCGWQDGLVGNASVGIDDDSQAGYTLNSADPVVVRDLATETRFSGPPLLAAHGVRSGMSVVIEGSRSRPFGVFGVHDTAIREFDRIDADSLTALANIVAESVRHAEAQQQQALLMREIAHRSNNLLQVIGVIAGQTFASDGKAGPAQVAFRERLSAIARANDLITRGGWSLTRFRNVVEETLRPYVDRLSIKGRDILLPPQLCFDLGLVLHELATNSIKYGSLGMETGNIDIAWELQTEPDGGETFCLSWEDRSGAILTASGHGFGSRLKKALVIQKWNGELTIDRDEHYRFSCRIPVPECDGGKEFATAGL